ncbi:hypothetical protein MNEG_7895 [Monoraphidium neglectum]|uniref:Amino acid transporter transmembrane domain-containing protein n=1 Tax=Monoraphidium neglectum TaxID=145388 RepID=A0A0D2MHA7_9CHLO|nr:hypothetical protein MNEG_7895 [Monoraphidium neglectum]KIZ00067.1 hypothetical protein MNEG_7895 [Monoraphidium neglectum]|eukprot:XP_013899086.1 hypothetical protein MNEG_7895 [Monoraphidium neglectum]
MIAYKNRFSCPAASGRRAGAHWLAIAVVLTTDMLGVGTLGLPADFARLGWLPALLTMALFIGGGVYSGSIYQRLALRVPDAVVFDQIGSAAMGNLGRGLMLYGYEVSGLVAHALVVILILPLAQMHHLEDVAIVGIFGTLAMLVAIAVVVGKLLATYLAAGGAPPAPTELVAGGSFYVAMVGVVDIAFSFGGQIK